jgi:hypothetical protein
MNETTVAVTRETQHLAYLAGCMNAARRDYKRALAENAPACVIEELQGDAMGCEEDFRFEFQAVAALQELQAAPVAAKVSKPRCPHWKLISRFFGIARDAGLDTSKAAKPKMRHAMETQMGRCVNSRSEVSAGEWELLGDLVKAGRLAW